MQTLLQIGNIFCGTSASLDREVTRFVFMMFALFALKNTHRRGGSGRSSFSGFFPERGEHGSRVLGKKPLKLLRQNPTLLCVYTTTRWQTVGETLARIETSSNCRQQFANMLLCLSHTHTNLSLPTRVGQH